ncbi:MAG: NAD(P)-binding domain-containing protein, partial [Pseudomonadota bacterium]
MPPTKPPSKKGVSIAIIGASGNVGSSVVRRLLSYNEDSVSKVITINRRNLDGLFPQDSRLEHHVVDMSSAEILAQSCRPI